MLTLIIGCKPQNLEYAVDEAIATDLLKEASQVYDSAVLGAAKEGLTQVYGSIDLAFQICRDIEAMRHA